MDAIPQWGRVGGGTGGAESLGRCKEEDIQAYSATRGVEQVGEMGGDEMTMAMVWMDIREKRK